MSDERTTNNQVYLCGRLAAPPSERELPSGDTLTTFRLVVDRPDDDRVRVDSLDCVTTVARVRRSVTKAKAGDWLEVSGSLRRRFWRGPAGVSSRYAVEVTAAKIVRRSATATGRAGGAARARKRASA